MQKKNLFFSFFLHVSSIFSIERGFMLTLVYQFKFFICYSVAKIICFLWQSENDDDLLLIFSDVSISSIHTIHKSSQTEVKINFIKKYHKSYVKTTWSKHKIPFSLKVTIMICLNWC